MLKWKKEIWIVGFVCLVVGMVTGYLIAYHQLVSWGVEKEQQKVELLVHEIRQREKEFDRLLDSLRLYDRELTSLFDELRLSPSDED